MNNVTDLRDELAKVFHELKAGALEPRHASELNNAAGKIINSARVELEYYNLRNEKPEISFLEGGK